MFRMRLISGQRIPVFKCHHEAQVETLVALFGDAFKPASKLRLPEDPAFHFRHGLANRFNLRLCNAHDHQMSDQAEYPS